MAGTHDETTQASPPASPQPQPVAEVDTWRLSLRFWREWMAPYKAKLALGMMLMVITAAATACYPRLIEQTIALLKGADPSVIWLMPVLALVVTAIRGASYFAQMVVTNSVVMRVVANIQEEMFAHLTRADLYRLIGDSAGHLITRFTNDVNALRVAMMKVISNTLRDVFLVIALVGVMIYYDWVLTLIVLVVYPLAFYPITLIGRRLRRVAHNTQTHMGDMTAFLQESLSGARMVKAYGLEDNERKRASHTFERMRRLWMKNIHHKARLEPMLEVLGGIAVSGVIAFGGWRIASGTGSLETFVGFISALVFMAQPIRGLGTLNAILQEGLAAAARVYAILEEQPAIHDRPGAQPLAVTQGRLEFEDVSFFYTEDTPALSGVSMEVPGGQTVALVGRSGAGKSTVFNLIPRFFDIDEGVVRIDGQDIRTVTVASLRGAMALVSQDVTIFNDTVRANIAFGGLDADHAAIEEAARSAAAHDFIARLPEGYDTIVGDRGVKLSGGERQRIALARAVLKDAPILLLDEATSALDAESERLVQRSLETLARDRTTLVIAHRLATVRRADLIYVLDRGVVVESGNHHTLYAKGGIYTQLCKLQFTDEEGGLGDLEDATLIRARV